MRRKTTAFVALAAASALVLAGCSSNGDDKNKEKEKETTSSSQPADDGNKEASGDGVQIDGSGNVEVVTWWEQGSEKEGLQALEKIFGEQHPNFEFVNAAVAGGGGDNAKQKLQADLDSGNPPDTFQAHAGAELADYIASGQLEDVSGLYDEFKLRDAFPDTLIDRLTVDGKIYSIPSNIHRANVVWANPQVIKDAGLDPEKPAADIDAWIADMEKIAEAGKIPLTVGTEWTQLQLLETVLLSSLGAEKYNGLWDGSTDWTSDEVGKALANYDKIFQLAKRTNGYLSGQDWEVAMGPIADGQAAYNVMGDWAIAFFDSKKMKYGDDYIAFPVPGTDGVFDFLADSFTLPKGAKNADGSKAWLHTISSVEGQVAFNKVKGSIPSRTDVDPGEFNAYQQDAIKAFASDTIVSSLAHGAAAPLSVSEAMKTTMGKYAQGAADLEKFQAELAEAAAKLKK